MVVAGWFEGVTTEQLTAAAAARLRAGEAFTLQWWGLADAPKDDRRLARALEMGDRAWKDAERENSGTLTERQDWILSKAVAACPMPFTGFLALTSRARAR
jgi:hypothetical protein